MKRIKEFKNIKKILYTGLTMIVVILTLTNQVSAKDLYVSTAGDDSVTYENNDINHPWRTIDKVNRSVFLPGDNIYFKRGDMWREQLLPPTSGTSGNTITYSSYGAGDKPKILGSITKNNAGDWIEESANIWYTQDTAFMQTFLIMFGPESQANIGEPKETKAEIIVQRDFWYDDPNDRVYTFSTSNPATLYGTIEIPNMNYPVRIDDKSYLTITGLDIRYARTYSISTVGHTSRVTIRGNDVSYSGGHLHGGNGINISQASSWVTVAENNVSQVYDYAIGVHNYGSASFGTMRMHHITVRDNIISTSSGGITITALTHGEDGVSIDNINVYGNTITDSGYGWSRMENNNEYLGRALGARGVGLSILEDVGAEVRDINFHNNVISHWGSYGIRADRAIANLEIFANKITGGTKDSTHSASQLGAGIRVSNGCSTNIHHNIVADNTRSAIRTVNNDLPITIYNNTFSKSGGTDTADSVIVSLNSSNEVIKNNITYSSTGRVFSDGTTGASNLASNVYYKETPGGGIWRSNNIDYDTLAAWATAYRDGSYEVGSQQVDPLFTSATDYHLQNTSLAIDTCSAAVWQGTPNITDYEGSAVTDAAGNVVGAMDCGAYSYNIATIIRADVDQNSIINSTDALLTLRNSLGLDMSSTNWQASGTTGDVDCSSNTNSTDALLILRNSLGLEMSGTGWCAS